MENEDIENDDLKIKDKRSHRILLRKKRENNSIKEQRFAKNTFLQKWQFSKRNGPCLSCASIELWMHLEN